MQVIRETMRAHRVPGLSVPQFRTLAMVYHNPDISLSEAAEHIGLGLPSASKLIDGLVARQFILRTEDAADRRCKRLRATAAGKKCFLSIHKHAEERLAGHLSSLPAGQAKLIVQAMDLLKHHLAPSGAARLALEKTS